MFSWYQWHTICTILLHASNSIPQATCKRTDAPTIWQLWHWQYHRENIYSVIYVKPFNMNCSTCYRLPTKPHGSLEVFNVYGEYLHVFGYGSTYTEPHDQCKMALSNCRPTCMTHGPFIVCFAGNHYWMLIGTVLVTFCTWKKNREMALWQVTDSEAVIFFMAGKKFLKYN